MTAAAARFTCAARGRAERLVEEQRDDLGVVGGDLDLDAAARDDHAARVVREPEEAVDAAGELGRSLTGERRPGREARFVDGLALAAAGEDATDDAVAAA